jgi:hypothetical protein
MSTESTETTNTETTNTETTNTETTNTETTNTKTPATNGRRYRALVTANGKTVVRLYGDDADQLTRFASNRFTRYVNRGARYADWAVHELVSKTSPKRGVWKELKCQVHRPQDKKSSPAATPAPVLHPEFGDMAVALSRFDYLLTSRIHTALMGSGAFNDRMRHAHVALASVRQAREAVEAMMQPA